MTEDGTGAQSIAALRKQHERQYEVYHSTSIQEHLDDLADRRERCPVSFSPKGEFWTL